MCELLRKGYQQSGVPSCLPFNSVVAFGQKASSSQAPSSDVSRELSVPSASHTVHQEEHLLLRFPTPSIRLWSFRGGDFIKMQGNVGLSGPRLQGVELVASEV